MRNSCRRTSTLRIPHAQAQVERAINASPLPLFGSKWEETTSFADRFPSGIQTLTPYNPPKHSDAIDLHYNDYTGYPRVDGEPERVSGRVIGSPEAGSESPDEFDPYILWAPRMPVFQTFLVAPYQTASDLPKSRSMSSPRPQETSERIVPGAVVIEGHEEEINHTPISGHPSYYPTSSPNPLTIPTASQQVLGNAIANDSPTSSFANQHPIGELHPQLGRSGETPLLSRMHSPPATSPSISGSSWAMSPQLVDYTSAYYMTMGQGQVPTGPTPSVMSPHGTTSPAGMSIGMMSPPEMLSPSFDGEGFMVYRGYEERFR